MSDTPDTSRKPPGRPRTFKEGDRQMISVYLTVDEYDWLCVYCRRMGDISLASAMREFFKDAKAAFERSIILEKKIT